jgi:hypothetical protein
MWQKGIPQNLLQENFCKSVTPAETPEIPTIPIKPECANILADLTICDPVDTKLELFIGGFAAFI